MNTTNETLTKLTTIFNTPSPLFTKGGVTTATLILDSHNILGECILYDDITNTILWTDINGKQFHSLHLNTGIHTIIPLPKMLGSFALRPKGKEGYLFAWEDGFQLYDVKKNVALSDMSMGEDVNPIKLPTRLNDGRCDSTGKYFICGGYFGSLDGTFMKVYKCSFEESEGKECNDDDDDDDDGCSKNKLVHEPIVEKIQTTNSICWSTDGSHMYLADSEQHLINRYDYNVKKGTLTNQTKVAIFDDGVPDGSCTDSNGNIWNALWRDGAGPSRVQCIDPSTGEVIYTVNMPDSTSQLTCCCFGGPDLDVLFISSAHVNRDREKEPNAGCVYAVKLGIKGCLEQRFHGKL